MCVIMEQFSADYITITSITTITSMSLTEMALNEN